MSTIAAWWRSAEWGRIGSKTQWRQNTEVSRAPPPEGSQPLRFSPRSGIPLQVNGKLGPSRGAWHTNLVMALLSGLTPRHRHAAALVAAGLPNREVGRAAGLSEWRVSRLKADPLF